MPPTRRAADGSTLRLSQPRSYDPCFFFSSRRRHTSSLCDWSSDVCSSDLSTSRKDVTFCSTPSSIHDIRPEEIHVLEDGVEQKVTSFRLVEGKTAELSIAPKSSESGSLALDPMREVRLVTLVFENMDQEGKRFFRQSLKDILDMSPEQNLYFSILTVDHGLHVIQPLTSDHAALLRSWERSMTWSFTQYENQSAEVKQELKQVLAGDEPQLQSSPSGGASQAQVQSVVNYRMAKMQYDMLEEAEGADRAYNGRATIDGLLALVRAQSELPGRKVVL